MTASSPLTRKIVLRWHYWFWLGNSVFIWLVASHLFYSLSFALQQTKQTYAIAITWIFILLAYFSYLAIFTLLPAIISLLLNLFFRSKWLCEVIGTVLMLFFAICLTLDSYIYQFFRFHLNSILFDLVKNGKMPRILVLTPAEWMVVVGILLFYLLVEIGIAKLAWRLSRSTSRRMVDKLFIGAIILSFIISLQIFIYANASGFRQYQEAARILPYYNNMAADLTGSSSTLLAMQLQELGYVIQPAQATGQLQYPLHPMQCQLPTKPLNVVIIGIDAWRFNMLNATVTPNLMQFAQQAWQFNNHFSGGNSSLAGIFSLFYGMPSTYWTSMLVKQQSPVLMQEFVKNHYQIGIFSSSPLDEPQFDKTVFADIQPAPIQQPADNTLQRDGLITQNFLNFLQTRRKNQPFFSFLFYEGAHDYVFDQSKPQPFNPYMQHLVRISFYEGYDRQTLMNTYQNALYLVDQRVAQVIAALKKENLLDNTVIIITGDHGEEFNDTHQNIWFHASDYTRYQTQTPFIVYWPHEAPKVFNQITQHIDVAPTLLGRVFNCTDSWQDYSLGQDLLQAKPVPYRIVGSYIGYAIIEPDRITQVYANGAYAINDINNQPIENAKIDPAILAKAYQDMWHFYK